jgi:hypothetical protein
VGPWCGARHRCHGDPDLVGEPSGGTAHRSLIGSGLSHRGAGPAAGRGRERRRRAKRAGSGGACRRCEGTREQCDNEQCDDDQRLAEPGGRLATTVADPGGPGLLLAGAIHIELRDLDGPTELRFWRWRRRLERRRRVGFGERIQEPARRLGAAALSGRTTSGVDLFVGLHIDDPDRRARANLCGLEQQFVWSGADHLGDIVEVEDLGRHVHAIAVGGAGGLVDFN